MVLHEFPLSLRCWVGDLDDQQLIQRAYETTPPAQWEHWVRYDNDFEKKRTSRVHLSREWLELLAQLGSHRITERFGIAGLKVDFSLHGGGCHVVDPGGYRVDLYYSNGGSQASVSDAAGPFTFSNVPMGLHAVRVVKTSNPNAGNTMVEDTVVVRPGTTNAGELWF